MYLYGKIKFSIIIIKKIVMAYQGVSRWDRELSLKKKKRGLSLQGVRVHCIYIVFSLMRRMLLSRDWGGREGVLGTFSNLKPDPPGVKIHV